jgi:hypothetical protein
MAGSPEQGSPSAREVLKGVVDMLAEHVDDTLGSHGFRRRGNSRNYRRNVASGYQTIQFDSSPYSAAGPSAIHIDPYGDVIFPEVNELAKKIAGREDVFPRGDLTLRGRLQLLVPAGNRFWVATDLAELGDLGPVLRGHTERWLLPFLEKFSSPRSLVENDILADELPYERTSNGVLVGAAHLLLGDRERAAEALIQRYNPDACDDARFGAVLAAAEKLRAGSEL